ncbi:MAG: hypothetical protein DWQ36_10715 [Acidobacteria bacterium]|nr:MAG: hypothetical protein DWQ30_12690 [Acidobacteriota bacterium]REK07684.1 MAG: hypothetical protein DWQ36_10715 [Acidobacteriota bacterium]
MITLARNVLPLSLFQAIEATWLAELIQQSHWIFPVVMSLHLVAFAALGGAILVVDLRLLGLVFRPQPVQSLARSVRWLLHGSVAAMFVTGLLLFVSEAIKCYYNDPFWIKMYCLAGGLIVTYTVRRKIVAMDPARVGVWGKLVGLTNIALWSGVAWGGRWIGFWG